MSPFHYATEGMLKMMFDGVDILGYTECTMKLQYPCYGKTGKQVLQALSSSGIQYDEVNPWIGVLILMSIAVVTRMLFYQMIRKRVY